MIKPINAIELINCTATQLNILSVIEEESVIIADVLDQDSNTLSRQNWFFYKGANKNVPFTLTKAEIKEINNPE